MGSRGRAVSLSALAVLLAAAGCASAPRSAAVDRHSLKQKARRHLELALRYPHNPVVRVEAVEALQAVPDEGVRPWIRATLMDEHPAVRFAACVACGRLRDPLASDSIRELAHDEDPSVRAAALYARHRLGHTGGTGKLPYYLLEHADPAVRRNAALLLGLLGEHGAIKVLAKAMRDPDDGVRHHALEAMARLGNAEAAQELTFLANSGVGTEEVFAIGALATTGDPRYVDTYRYKLATAVHVETKLAATRALGLLGHDDGFAPALRSLDRRRVRRHEPADTPGRQLLRVRQLACAALGAIGREDALPALAGLLEETDDPRVQVSAAGAMLHILARRDVAPLPFERDATGG